MCCGAATALVRYNWVVKEDRTKDNWIFINVFIYAIFLEWVDNQLSLQNSSIYLLCMLVKTKFFYGRYAVLETLDEFFH